MDGSPTMFSPDDHVDALVLARVSLLRAAHDEHVALDAYVAAYERWGALTMDEVPDLVAIGDAWDRLDLAGQQYQQALDNLTAARQAVADRRLDLNRHVNRLVRTLIAPESGGKRPDRDGDGRDARGT